jgi:hypothetical protein
MVFRVDRKLRLNRRDATKSRADAMASGEGPGSAAGAAAFPLGRIVGPASASLPGRVPAGSLIGVPDALQHPTPRYLAPVAGDCRNPASRAR